MVLLWLGPVYAFFIAWVGLFGSYFGELYRLASGQRLQVSASTSVAVFRLCAGALSALPRWSASSFLLVCAARSFSSRGSSCSSCRTPRGSRKNIRLNTRRRVNSRRTSQRDWLHRRDGYRPIATAQVTACLRCGHLATPAALVPSPGGKILVANCAPSGTQAPEREQQSNLR